MFTLLSCHVSFLNLAILLVSVICLNTTALKSVLFQYSSLDHLAWFFPYSIANLLVHLSFISHYFKSIASKIFSNCARGESNIFIKFVIWLDFWKHDYRWLSSFKLKDNWIISPPRSYPLSASHSSYLEHIKIFFWLFLETGPSFETLSFFPNTLLHQRKFDRMYCRYSWWRSKLIFLNFCPQRMVKKHN